MSHLTHKTMRIGKYSIPVLILLALAVGTVAAAVYVVLQFTASVTVKANPAVCFYEWGTATKKNSFDETFNIFPGVKTTNENATHAIYNWETSSRTCYLRISDITTPENIETVYIKVVGTTVEITWNSGESLPTSWTSLTVAAGTKYVIWIEVTAKSTATPDTSSVITFDMKVESP